MSSGKINATAPLPGRAIRAAAGEDALRLAHRAAGGIRRAEAILAAARETEAGKDPAARREMRRRALAEADALQRLSEQLAEAQCEVADALALTSRALAASNAYRSCGPAGASR